MGASRDFDGTNDEIAVTPAWGSDGDATVRFQFRMDALPSAGNVMRIYTQQGNSGKGVSAWVESDGTLRVEFARAGGIQQKYRLDWSAGVSTGTWYTVAVSYKSWDGSSRWGNLYVDGVLRDSSLTKTTPGGTSLGSTLYFGTNRDATGDWLNGQVAHFLLIEDQFENSAEAVLMQLTYAPYIWWDANVQLVHPLFGEDSPELDWSGRGKTGTVTGATESTDGPPVFLCTPAV